MSNVASVAWIVHWEPFFEFLNGLPPYVLAALSLFLIFTGLIIPSVALISYLERKLAADFQARVGASLAGPAGIFQPLVDFVKLQQKDMTTKTSARERAWLAVHTMALYSTVAVLPLGSTALLLDTDLSALLPFWAALVLGLGAMFLGLSQENVPGWYGGIRLAAQSLAGGFPSLISILTAGIAAGGFKWSTIVAAQSAIPLFDKGWIGFSNPFQFIAMVCFGISGLVLLGIPPMDAPHTTVELHGGVSSLLSSRRLTLFRLGRLYGFFLWSLITVVLFLGGWNMPFGLAEKLSQMGSFHVLQVFELGTLLLKTYFVMLGTIWISKVNPRARVDQVTDFAWTVLSPFSLFALIGAALLSAWRQLV